MKSSYSCCELTFYQDASQLCESSSAVWYFVSSHIQYCMCTRASLHRHAPLRKSLTQLMLEVRQVSAWRITTCYGSTVITDNLKSVFVGRASETVYLSLNRLFYTLRSSSAVLESRIWYKLHHIILVKIFVATWCLENCAFKYS